MKQKLSVLEKMFCSFQKKKKVQNNRKFNFCSATVLTLLLVPPGKV